MDNRIVKDINEFVIDNYNDIQLIDKYSLFNQFCKTYKITVSYLPDAIEYMNVLNDLRKIEINRLKVALDVDKEPEKITKKKIITTIE